MALSKTVETVLRQIVETQAETGVATAGLEDVQSAAEQIGTNAKKIIALCDQFLL